MGCPNLGIIGKSLSFTVRSLLADVPVDADSNPTYSVYEGNTDTPILTGTTSKLDDAATTGLYVGVIAITLSAGFERYKTYTIDVSITVSGQTTNQLFSFLCVGS